MNRIATLVAVVVSAIVGLSLAAPAHAWIGDLQPDYTTQDDGWSHHIGSTYEHSNGGGNFYRWWGGGQCSSPYNNYDYYEASLSQESFINTASSIADYNSCDTKLWAASYATGPNTGWVHAGSMTNLSGIGFNDRANSIDWS